MDRFTRIHELHRLLSSRRTAVPRAEIERLLECSRATAQRCLRDLRDYLNAPVVYDAEYGGYRYDPDRNETYELPGLWFRPAEIRSLALLDHLLERLAPGLLRSHLAPFSRRIEQLLASEAPTGTVELKRRLRILPLGFRPVNDAIFATVTEALLRRVRLRITYRSRHQETSTERVVSPQRLAHYRDNWYLDAWCHRRRALRSFALDRIAACQPHEETADEIPEQALEQHFAAAYGIFAGPANHTALLRFTPRAARWVAEERWHPDQQSRWLPDGQFELQIPYGNPTEIIMDILRYGPDCEVVEPAELREAVRTRLREAALQYEGPVRDATTTSSITK